MAHDFNPNVRKIDTGEVGVQGHLLIENNNNKWQEGQVLGHLTLVRQEANKCVVFWTFRICVIAA